MHKSGSFTMPAETGYEHLTLELADRWGADAIRDCDGVRLPRALLDAGLDVYATICIIRDHNAFIAAHPHYRQQTILESRRTLSMGTQVTIALLDGYSTAQFAVNDDAISRWQVHDRTTGALLDPRVWSYDTGSQTVTIEESVPYHEYSVNFFAFRIWEEINMYNHLTNDWKSEPLGQLDPRYPEVREYLRSWLEAWCEAHPEVDIVRFTSLFYNFVWIWSDSEQNPHLFTDWASYDFTVSPLALSLFEEEYGYPLTGEHFINGGYRNPSHIVWREEMIDYLHFTNRFVCSFAKELVDIVHKSGKRAYVFYDDSWVGMEPQTPAFASIGFDGIIKCAFSGFEARLCSAVRAVQTHEIRLHPYLFPVGLGGDPTFSGGGDPAGDAWRYWASIRRGILEENVDRIGLGGILHLVEGFPTFVDAIETIADEFRMIKDLHSAGRPWRSKTRVGILTAWGTLRSWTCGGHYHEHPDLDLINILESLSGLPVDVQFLDFCDLTHERLQSLDIIINAGFGASAYSGGRHWDDPGTVASLTEWVSDGGVFIGVNEPSYTTGVAMGAVLGIDIDDGRLLCHGRWSGRADSGSYAHFALEKKANVRLLHSSVEVIQESDGVPQFTVNELGKGKGIYLSGYRHCLENSAALSALIENLGADPYPISSDNPSVEWTWFPASERLVVANGSAVEQRALITQDGKTTEVELSPWQLRSIALS